MIVMDLEWNRGYDKKPLDEILQIGALRVDRLGGAVLDQFNAYIRPVVHKKMDPGAKCLPELEASRASGLDFAGAMEKFRAWCGGETEYALWGGGDFDVLEENCKYWGVPPLKAKKIFDFQGAFSRVVGTGQQISLWRAAEYCGIPDSFTFHNALNDAMYTALVGGWLTEEDLSCGTERRGKIRLSRLPFTRQPRQKVGPCQTPEEVLDSGDGRSPPCPVCGQTGYVSQWYTARTGGKAGPRRYYTVFCCPEHGRFLCRLTVTRTEEGLWQGRRSVPVLTSEVLREYDAARQGEVHRCRGRRRRRRRSRRRAAPPEK